MAKNIGIGVQDFSKLRKKNRFYIDKTSFIKEWWENGEEVTLITRPRRFGKTLNMSMVEHFFSLKYANEGAIFEGLSIWKEEEYRNIQGTYPVISLSFARIQENNFEAQKEKICEILRDLYIEYSFLKQSDVLTEADKAYFDLMLSLDIKENLATSSLYQLSKFLYHYYGKSVIILLDEYDTPMQEAYVNGFWEELTSFTRSLFNSTFKTNPFLEKAIMTGITRVSKESVFSGVNNLRVITATTKDYATSFGFTEEEVFRALDENGLGNEKEKVKEWYNGFVFGKHSDIYNPWSITNFLNEKIYKTYWSNTSGNALVNKLIQEGGRGIKQSMEQLLKGESVKCCIDEQIVYNQLDYDGEVAIWSLLVASGYLKILNPDKSEEDDSELIITNLEVRIMFEKMVRGWFRTSGSNYNSFVKSLLKGDLEEMNHYMNKVALSTFSYFDVGGVSAEAEPERFYHGFVLGLLVEFRETYEICSNRESGLGRYDVMLIPRRENNITTPAIILEFKVHNPKKEKNMEETVANALRQIKEKEYDARLLEMGIKPESIHHYGFAFKGKNVLIGSNGKSDEDSELSIVLDK